MSGLPGVFLRATWQHLLMLNFEVEPRLLAPDLPGGTELDLQGGRTWVSVVGFRFLDTRVLGVPVPGHVDFDEVNLRFYVRRKGPEGWRRGVVFVKELVPRRLLAWVARRAYGENYQAVPMRHEVRPPGATEPGLARYGWSLGGRWHEVAARFEGEPAVPPEGSEAGFIAEHYWGYTRRAGGRTDEYRVEHPPWRVWAACDAALDCDAAAVYGTRFVDVLGAAPTSAFVAEGSPVLVRRGRSLPPG